MTRRFRRGRGTMGNSPPTRAASHPRRVWRAAANRTAQHVILLCWIVDQLRGLRLPQHPLQRDLRQPALGFGIAAADVAVHAGKPDLLDIPGPPSGASGRQRCVRKNARRSSMAIACRPIAMSADCRRVGQVSADFRSSRPSSPCPRRRRSAACSRGCRRCSLKSPREREIVVQILASRPPFSRSCDRHHHPDGVGHQGLVAGPDQAVHVQQGRHGAHRVGAAAEAEQKTRSPGSKCCIRKT